MTSYIVLKSSQTIKIPFILSTQQQISQLVMPNRQQNELSVYEQQDNCWMYNVS